ncbi:MAG: HAD-IA family hydrolase [Pelolinea sp.]|nr:HAD-IA family hydrolase [Pelolinea sp.]
MRNVPLLDIALANRGGERTGILFLKAANRMEVIPLNCLVFEDAVAGVQAAKAAGMKCIAVTTTNPAEKLADADLVLNNLAEMMTDHILQLFTNA